VSVLFGTIFGLSPGQAATNSLVCLGVSVAVLVMARPLLFASLDEAVARARGVPARWLGLAFLGLVGVTAAAASQAVGALLLLGLLAAPAGAAQRLTARPYRAMWLSAVIAIVSVWGGLSIAYAAPEVPPSFGILAVSTGSYLLAYAVTAARHALRRMPGRPRTAPTWRPGEPGQDTAPVPGPPAPPRPQPELTGC
jgi:zinc/manganese transport system permease protein